MWSLNKVVLNYVHENTKKLDFGYKKKNSPYTMAIEDCPSDKKKIEIEKIWCWHMLWVFGKLKVCSLLNSRWNQNYRKFGRSRALLNFPPWSQLEHAWPDNYYIQLIDHHINNHCIWMLTFRKRRSRFC